MNSATMTHGRKPIAVGDITGILCGLPLAQAVDARLSCSAAKVVCIFQNRNAGIVSPWTTASR